MLLIFIDIHCYYFYYVPEQYLYVGYLVASPPKERLSTSCSYAARVVSKVGWLLAQHSLLTLQVCERDARL